MKAVRDDSRPTTKKVRALIGFASYHRRFYSEVCRNDSTTVAENLGGGGGGGAGASQLRIAMNIHSMKLFNNLIKNTLLAPMFCDLVKSQTLQCTLPARLQYT